MSRGRGWIGLAILAVGGLVAGLAMLEGLLRLTALAPDNFWQPDAVLGHAHIPGARGEWKASCFSAPVVISGQGLRDREFPVARPPRTYRIAVLGDSMTEGLQVRVDQTYPKVLERRLAEVTGAKVEVMNFAVSGYGTGQLYLQLRTQVLAFKPDLVVFPVFPINDVRETSVTLEGRGDKPYFYLDGGTLALRGFPFPPPYHELKRFVRSLYLYRVVGARFMKLDAVRTFMLWLGVGTRINPDLDREGRGAQVTDVPFDLQIYVKDYPPAWRAAWVVMDAVLGRAAADSRAAGAELLLVGLPSIVEVVDGARLRQEYPAFDETRFDTQAPYRMLERIARDRDLPYVSLVGAFQADLKGGRRPEDLYYPCDNHFAPAGHEVVAAALAGVIAPRVARQGAARTP